MSVVDDFRTVSFRRVAHEVEADIDKLKEEAVACATEDLHVHAYRAGVINGMKKVLAALKRAENDVLGGGQP